tara:strand:+ start:1113 stop:1289 length:177 start_codon:yes stop_codon:yes gene_type:complete
MANLTEITLQLIHKKLDEILIAITENRGAVERASVNTVTQEEFTAAMDEVIKLVNKNG